MSDFNQVTLTGRLGSDPSVRRTQDGRAVVNFNLAVGHQWRDKNTGEKRDKVTWVPIVVFSEGLAKICEQYLKKGSRVLLQGELSVREYEDKQNNKRTVTEVVLQGFNATLTMLDKAERGDDYGEARQSRGRPQQQAPQDDMSDDIPW